jgi:hypothetical protein
MVAMINTSNFVRRRRAHDESGKRTPIFTNLPHVAVTVVQRLRVPRDT